MHRRSKCILAMLFIAASVANSQGPSKQLEDRFLDHFVGDWRTERKFPSGRVAEGTVRCEWVLKHHFIELHYLPEYEAMVFIGFDESDQNYVCHWVDIFGAHFAAVGRGKMDANLLSIEFRFQYKDGGLTNKFTFDPATKTWTSLIRQEEKGEWKTFCEEKWTGR